MFEQPGEIPLVAAARVTLAIQDNHPRIHAGWRQVADYFRDVAHNPPFTRLPDEITLTRDEIAVVLFALDVVDDAGIDGPARAEVTRAIRIITAKLWPELGDILGDESE